jgi:hypothetical protein
LIRVCSDHIVICPYRFEPKGYTISDISADSDVLLDIHPKRIGFGDVDFIRMVLAESLGSDRDRDKTDR